MIYMGNFIYVTNQQKESELDRRHGEFSLVVQAENSESAIEAFKQRIVETYDATELFEGECRIFFVQLYEFDTFPVQNALMLNYKSIAGDPAMPFIRCSVPGEDQGMCRIFDWKNNQPEIDGKDEQLFLAFSA